MSLSIRKMLQGLGLTAAMTASVLTQRIELIPALVMATAAYVLSIVRKDRSG